MTRIATFALVATLSATAGGCATWDKLSRPEKGAVVGAAAGGIIGGSATDSMWGTVGGAAVGGVIGHEVGKRR